MPVDPSSPLPGARRRRAAPPDRERMGVRLRTLRKARGLTLKALAARSGVALSTLSKIELGQVVASYEKFAAVAHALEVEIGALFDPHADAPARGRATVVRSTPSEAPRYDAEHYEYRALAAAFPGKRMTPMHGTIVARRRDEFTDYVRHPGQEFMMVLSGRVRIEFETGEAVELGRHESAYFDSGVGHIYLSLGKGSAQVMVVMAERW